MPGTSADSIGPICSAYPAVAGLFWGKVLNSLRALFRREPEPMLGLDVSSSSIKLVELGKNKAGELVLER